MLRNHKFFTHTSVHLHLTPRMNMLSLIQLSTLIKATPY